MCRGKDCGGRRCPSSNGHYRRAYQRAMYGARENRKSFEAAFSPAEAVAEMISADTDVAALSRLTLEQLQQVRTAASAEADRQVTELREQIDPDTCDVVYLYRPEEYEQQVCRTGSAVSVAASAAAAIEMHEKFGGTDEAALRSWAEAQPVPSGIAESRDWMLRAKHGLAENPDLAAQIRAEGDDLVDDARFREVTEHVAFHRSDQREIVDKIERCDPEEEALEDIMEQGREAAASIRQQHYAAEVARHTDMHAEALPKGWSFGGRTPRGWRREHLAEPVVSACGKYPASMLAAAARRYTGLQVRATRGGGYFSAMTKVSVPGAREYMYVSPGLAGGLNHGARPVPDTPANREKLERFIEVNNDPETYPFGVSRLPARKKGTYREFALERQDIDGEPHLVVRTATKTSTGAMQYIPTINTTFSESTAVHEIGHAVEDGNGYVGKACRRFLARRTAGCELIKEGRIRGADVMVRGDSFTDSYIGRDYGDNTGSTEVFTVGMEGLAESNKDTWIAPANKNDLLGSSDPDHRNLIMGLLAAAPRTKDGTDA